MEEMTALKQNETWEIVELPRNKKPVGCKWVFTIKFLWSLAVNLDRSLYQLDVKNTFLNGDLEEEVFISLPPGLEKELASSKICKLKKSLYGLKQSPRAWFERFGKVVQLILTGDDEASLDDFEKKLASEFQIKDLGLLKYFLGMEFARSKKGIFVNKRKYVLDLLEETSLLGCRIAKTPIRPNLKLLAAKAKEIKDREQYQRLLGRLIYCICWSPEKGILFKRNNHFQVEGYTNAD
ncbi:cysteine-rich RLK RECEPTOR-like protein kinase [Cucumis melo var. makuwa]|uniref:Cysteine-rich RLK RECEPTOR-like protein kinase n=1 Tax=Cucumis melo var. makuwa TaxID=1194695 RepID=A0A5A7V6R9_CUCMM|nr:cysteine-rich RLK RECEPTOR-like protein kinase [Cucumis melo var. makuwa]TYK14724.1 cysteine-rich RLK RECEPTOR-like protein kinase [Cucumis melo var. makuwa]